MIVSLDFFLLGPWLGEFIGKPDARDQDVTFFLLASEGPEISIKGPSPALISSLFFTTLPSCFLKSTLLRTK
ncbi:hypothetical protein Golomagni_04211 [Golovinomyces magnicellulatus]|nr:hypothetical protein Golomagni_04211 [Golovinomyces magnicellulatus]